MNASRITGPELLAAYSEGGSESAFSELVRRYTDLVYSIARRRLPDRPLAEDVTQTVFTRLAAGAPKLRGDAELIAWLHRTTLHVSIDTWRSETRRRTREQQACAMQTPPADNTLWDQVAPELDEALNRLKAPERQVILLRFFEGRALREIGAILGVSEDAAKMRLGRAMERLRTHMARRGITCTAVALGTVLAERSVEAAPPSLLARLEAIELTGAGAGLGGGLFTAVLQLPKASLLAGLAVLLLVGFGTVTLVPSFTGEAADEEALNAPELVSAPVASDEDAQWRRLFPQRGAAWAEPERVKMMFRAVDAETGEGLGGASIRAAYFGPGGMGERVEVTTGEDGWAAITEPRDPGRDRGMNVFVRKEGYVPKVIALGREVPDEYTMALERALSAGGVIINEEGEPVPGVAIRIQRADDYRSGEENTDFQLAIATSDLEGRWVYRYIPKHYEAIRFVLTHEDYAVTLPVVPAEGSDLANLTFIMDQGFTVTGRVTDGQGNPIRGAQVREVNMMGYRRLATSTDHTGSFRLVGVWEEHEVRRPRPREMGPNGAMIFRGITGTGEPYTVLAVQAPGFEPLGERVDLTNSITVADFRLSRGHVLRGRVFSESGQPIAGAVVRTDSGSRHIEWNTVTDGAGGFEWDSAPDEGAALWFDASGYEPLRDVLLSADGTEHRIRLSERRGPGVQD